MHLPGLYPLSKTRNGCRSGNTDFLLFNVRRTLTLRPALFSAIALFSIIAVLPAVSSCGILRGELPDGGDDSARALAVREAVASRNIEVRITRVQTDFGFCDVTNAIYPFSLNGDCVNARLPFFGTADLGFNPVVSGIGIEFINCEVEVSEDASGKDPTKHVLRFQARSGSEVWDVELDVWENATVDIRCHSSFRSSMYYSGELVLK